VCNNTTIQKQATSIDLHGDTQKGQAITRSTYPLARLVAQGLCYLLQVRSINLISHSNTSPALASPLGLFVYAFANTITTSCTIHLGGCGFGLQVVPTHHESHCRARNERQPIQ